MKRILVTGIACLALLASGCYRTVYTGQNLAYMATMNRPQANETVVDHFRINKWNHFFFFALAPTSELDISELLEDRVKPGQAVRNLSIYQKATFGNMVVTFLALGGAIYSPITTVIEGDIVKIDKTAPAAAVPVSQKSRKQ